MSRSPRDQICGLSQLLFKGLIFWGRAVELRAMLEGGTRRKKHVAWMI